MEQTSVNNLSASQVQPSHVFLPFTLRNMLAKRRMVDFLKSNLKKLLEQDQIKIFTFEKKRCQKEKRQLYKTIPVRGFIWIGNGDLQQKKDVLPCFPLVSRCLLGMGGECHKASGIQLGSLEVSQGHQAIMTI